jgi:hypothetical protein
MNVSTEKTILHLLTRIAIALEVSNDNSDRAHDLNNKIYDLQRMSIAEGESIEEMLREQLGGKRGKRN